MENEVYLINQDNVIVVDEKMAVSLNAIDSISDFSQFEREDIFVRMTEPQILFYKLHNKENLNAEQIYTMTPPVIEDRREIIRKRRETFYRNESDPLYIAYIKYNTLGEAEKASNKFQEWINKVQEIKDNNPYPIE